MQKEHSMYNTGIQEFSCSFIYLSKKLAMGFSLKPLNSIGALMHFFFVDRSLILNIYP